MARAQQYSAKEFIRILRDNGYELVSCKGNHKKFEKDGKHIVVTAVHDINAMLARRIIRENNLIVN